MISPNMATMFCFITTDAVITNTALSKALKTAVDESFNRITVEGDMSTNDTVLVLASGLAKNKSISTKSVEGFEKFQTALKKVTAVLAEAIVKDGEGASKLIDIEVKGARSAKEADIAARAVANSCLVKTAMYGNDANFGRIVAKIGSAGVAVKPNKLDIRIKGIETKKVSIKINLGTGGSTAKIQTCDLTPDYIKINAKYPA